MALIETDGLVLKSYNLAEADKIVVLLTREHGVIRAVAKGAKRLKSRFGSALEPFSVVRVSYVQKDSVELVTIDRIDLVRSHFAAASDPAFLQKFSYLCDLLISTSPPHDPDQTLYRMVKACIEAAADEPAALVSTGVYFELWLVRLAGYLPDWNSCSDCRRGLTIDDEATLLANFHLVCGACRGAASGKYLHAGGRQLAALGMRLAPADFANESRDRVEELSSLSAVLKRLISQSIGREIVGETSLVSFGQKV